MVEFSLFTALAFGVFIALVLGLFVLLILGLLIGLDISLLVLEKVFLAPDTDCCIVTLLLDFLAFTERFVDFLRELGPGLFVLGDFDVLEAVVTECSDAELP